MQPSHDSQLQDGSGTPEIIERTCHVPVTVLEQLVGADIAIMRGPIAGFDVRSQLIEDTRTITLQQLAVHSFEVTPIRFWNMRGHNCWLLPNHHLPGASSYVLA